MTAAPGTGALEGGNLATIATSLSQYATADGVAAANIPEIAIGLYNTSGVVIDRLRDAGSLGDGFTIGLIGCGQFLFNGSSFDRERTPRAFISIAAVAVTAGTPQAIWVPASGKKFHLMGFCITSSVSSSIIVKDGTNEVFRVPVLAGAPIDSPANFANGYQSTAANNALSMDVTITGVVSGFVFGTEEF